MRRPRVDLGQEKASAPRAPSGYVMKRAGQGEGGLGGMLGGLLGGQPASADTTRTQATGSDEILGNLIGAAGKFLGP